MCNSQSFKKSRKASILHQGLERHYSNISYVFCFTNCRQSTLCMRFQGRPFNYLGQVRHPAANLYVAPQLIRTDTHSCPCCRLAVPQHDEQNHCSSCFSEKHRNLVSTWLTAQLPDLALQWETNGHRHSTLQKRQQTLKQIQLDAGRLMCQFWRSQGNSESQKLQWIAEQGLRIAHNHCTTCEKQQSNCLIITFAYASILLDFFLPGITVAHETGALSDIYSDQESQSPRKIRIRFPQLHFVWEAEVAFCPKYFLFTKNQTYFPTCSNFEVMLATNSLKIASSIW